MWLKQKRTKRKGKKLKSWYWTYGNVQNKEVTEVKLLGVKTQNNLSWTTQITDLSKRVMKMAGMVGRIATFLIQRHSQGNLSQSNLRSRYNYCCAVWGNAAQRDLRRLQNNSARMLLRWKRSVWTVILWGGPQW